MSVIQTFIFSKHYWTYDDAIRWLKDRRYKYEVDDKPKYMRFRQQDPDFDWYRTKTIYHKNKPIDFVFAGYNKPDTYTVPNWLESQPPLRLIQDPELKANRLSQYYQTKKGQRELRFLKKNAPYR